MLKKYSLCHASYKTNGRSRQVRDYWLNLAKFPERVEHCLSFEFNDFEVSREYDIEAFEKSGITRDGKTRFTTTEPEESSSAVRNWNASASLATGDFLLTIADDLVPSLGWDAHLDDLLEHKISDDFVATFTDDRCSRLSELSEDTLLPRHPLVSINLYKKMGYLFCPEYDSAGPDFDLLIVSLKRGLLLDCREIRFHHSIGPILSEEDSLLCGCAEAKETSEHTSSQKRIHSEPDKVWKIVQSRWRSLDIALGKLACINRLSSYVYSSMRPDMKNYSSILILKTFISYFLSRLLSKRIT